MIGRPTKYTPELIKKAREYLTVWSNEVDGVADVVPTIEGLALYLSIARDTVYDWIKSEEKAEFSYIVRDLLGKQGKILLNMGLKGDFNASITKLMLTKHNYSDKVETDNTTKMDLSGEVTFIGVTKD